VIDDQGLDDKILVAYHVQYLCTAIFNGQQIIKMVVKKGRTTSRISVMSEYMDRGGRLLSSPIYEEILWLFLAYLLILLFV
jgi:hypothetical protein